MSLWLNTAVFVLQLWQSMQKKRWCLLFFFFFYRKDCVPAMLPFLPRNAQWFLPPKRMVNCTFFFSSTDSDRKWNICRSSNELCFTHHSISGCGSGKQSFSLLCMHCCFEMPFPKLPEGNRWTQMYSCYVTQMYSRGIPESWRKQKCESRSVF